MSEPLKYVSVILPLKLEWTPCYSINPSDDEVGIGDRVKVRFAFKEYIGIVAAVDVTPEIDSSRILPVISVETSLEKVSPSEIALWRQVAEYYMCSVGEVYKSAYPVGKIHMEEARATSLAKIKERKVRMISGIHARLDRLKERLFNKERQSEKHREGTKVRSRLSAEIAALNEEIARTESFLNNLSEREDEIPSQKPEFHTQPQLTEAQADAYGSILEGFSAHKPVMLHGVTGSGKTEIYIKAAMETMRKGQNVLYLVPEIALSRQLEDRLYEHFGNTLLTFHSGESAASRRNTSETIRTATKNDNRYIVLGTRSALFLPHGRLGLIIVDEEHDSSYKQDSPAPRYNGRDTALMLARIHGADILLGSATPSLESLYNCANGKHVLVNLLERYHGATDSDIEIIDTKAERKKRGMCGNISRKLADHIKATLQAGGQVLILRSRRSWAPILQCEDCGEIMKCPHCNVSVSLHKNSAQQEITKCHYCGHISTYNGHCSRCNGNVISLGAGTQRIEEEISAIFPDARIARLDSDTAQNKKFEAKTIKDFSTGKLDILIGTQIISKGFDFSNLKLVAIIAADTLLGIQDFRADEKAFQVMEQLRGRCGRRGEKGLFVIQTSQPDHPVYDRLVKGLNNITTDTLMSERHAFNFPPYSRIVELTIKDTYEDRLQRMAYGLHGKLKSALNSNGTMPAVTEPYAPAVDMIADNHIRVIRISLSKDRMLSTHKKRIANAIREFEKKGKYDGHISINVDPS